MRTHTINIWMADEKKPEKERPVILFVTIDNENAVPQRGLWDGKRWRNPNGALIPGEVLEWYYELKPDLS